MAFSSQCPHMATLPAAPPATALRAPEDLESRIVQLRDELFALADAARATVPYDRTALHVSLQAASNELGRAERALRER